MSGASRKGPLQDKVTLITGASQGIGRAIAARLARDGSHLVVTSRRQEACEEVAAEARALGVEALALALDVSRSRVGQGRDRRRDRWLRSR